MFYQSPGRGESCARESCESVILVWAHNTAAVIGVLICIAILYGWFKYVAPSLNQGEEDREDHERQR